MDPNKPFIIVVDDDEEDRYLFNYCFTELGLQDNIKFFSDPVQFVKYAEMISSLNVKPSLIILDYKMPGMNGNAVVDYLKSKTEFENTPLVILSTIISEEKRDSLLRRGVTACYKKGMNYDELKQEIKEIVGFALPVQG
jgi:CheY-like chemotaxis protein